MVTSVADILKPSILTPWAGPESEVTDRHDEHVTVDPVPKPSGAFDGGMDKAAVAVTVADRHEKHLTSMTLLSASGRGVFVFVC